ncbi:MAG TPA: hypothetical protein VH186_38340 [Chloroflexia bacterium]|nr:hypothetical protein [Chloroflexia bacterium]
MPGKVKSTIRKGRKSNLTINFLVISLLLPLLLAACGESQPQPTATPNIIAEITPLPTPVPLRPNRLELGSEASPWGEIARYEMGPDDKLVEVPVKPELSSDLSKWFEAAPSLAAFAGAGTAASNNLFKLSVKPEIAKALENGSLKYMPSLDGGIRGVVVDAKTGLISALPSLQKFSPLVSPTGIAFGIATVIISAQFMEEINKQFETVNKNIEDVKNFLEEKEYSTLTGDMRYINEVRTAMNEQRLDPAEIERYRNQLETVERETLQRLDFYKARMSSTADKFNQVKLDKTLFFFRDEDKIKELQNLISEFNSESNSYLTALSVRGLSAQVICALPESRQTAFSRMQEVRDDSKAWLTIQQNFYDAVEKRIPQMDGLFADSKTRDQFHDVAQKNKATASSAYGQVDNILYDTMSKVSAQLKEVDAPLQIVVELDDQGKIKKVSKLTGK